MTDAALCAKLIDEAKSIAVLTGAGISTNAGIPDFRGPQGLYVTKRYDADRIFDIHGFYRDPKPFYEFARDFLHLEETIHPTFTHHFLSELEREGKLTGLVTQNIDALHQKAGSTHVLEMHGSFWQSHCLRCNKLFSFQELKDLIKAQHIPTCACQGVIKPDIVFFGENVHHYEESAARARESDLFFVIGSSCVVQPAAIVPTLCMGKIVTVNQGKVHLNVYNVVLEIQEDCDEFFQRVSQQRKHGD